MSECVNRHKKPKSGRYRDPWLNLRLDWLTWRDTPAESFDFALMEKGKVIGCIAFNGKWSELRDWQAVGHLRDAVEHGNILNGPAHQIESKDTLLWVVKEGQVLTGIGLESIMVISMGNAVLVADRRRSQEVKAMVSELITKDINKAKQRERENRPWGWFETVAKNKRFHTKVLPVYVGGRLSVESYRCRSERWVIKKGEPTEVRGEQEFKVQPNESIYIHAGTHHQLRNDGEEGLEVIEVQTGGYFGEDDIVRYEDFCGRV